MIDYENRSESQTVTTAQGEAVIITIRVPQKRRFHLTGFSNTSDDVDAYGTTGLRWTVRADGHNVAGFTDMRDAFADGATPRAIPKGLVTAENIMTFIVTNDSSAGTSFKAGVNIRGEYENL